MDILQPNQRGSEFEPEPQALNCRLVFEYARQEGLHHRYTTLQHLSDHREDELVWMAVLRLGDRSFPSYPGEAATANEAKEIAARKAVTDLRLHTQVAAPALLNKAASSPEKAAVLVNNVVTNGNGFADGRMNSASNCTGQPEKLKDYVDVFVSHVTNTGDVFFRFLDYDAEYTQVLDKMATFYDGDSGTRPDDLQVGEGVLYATKYARHWLRVQPIAVHDEGLKIECFFVDEGITEFLAQGALMELEASFSDLPLQAIRCRLDRLTEYSGYDGIGGILSDVLLGKILVAEILNRDEPPTVVLHDTGRSGDINMNSIIMERLMGPRIPGKGCVGRCHLNHIRGDGVLWVKLSTPGITVIDKFVQVINNYCKRDNQAVDKPDAGKVCGNQSRTDVTFYGAVRTSPAPPPSREVLQCQLRNFTRDDGFFWNDKTSAAFLDIIGPDNPELIVKVNIPPVGSQAAVVELFKKHPETRRLVCINTELSRARHH